MKRILLHTCCAPCTIYPLETLRVQGWTVHGYFYNPNIHPYQEFERRMQAVSEYATSLELPMIFRTDYELEEFLRDVVFREDQRCLSCYSNRIDSVARLASRSKFEAFTTTLLFSKFQKHEVIKSIAEAASTKYRIPFHYEDFRTGWKQGNEEARRLSIYKQQYCGCIYSEMERFAPPRRKCLAANRQI